MLDAIAPGGRDRRLVSAILVLGTVVLFFVAVNLAASAIGFFGDVLLAFFLAWLLAFIISPVVTRIVDLIPRLPRVLATVLVYTLIVVVLVFLILVIAQALSNSITQFAASLPNIRANIGSIVAPMQGWLDSIGLEQVDLATQALAILDNLDEFAAQLIVPLQSIAVASVGAIGTMLIVFILSIYMVIDRDQIMAFLFRLVPPSYAEEARLLQTSVARSFGGFLRGQALMGIVYFTIALATHLGLGLEFTALSSVSAGVLMAIPFFGPFLAWAPPVLVALVTKPEVLLPTVVIMGAGWMVVMNALQPRIMQGAVGIHPIVVLGSVLIGSKIAGIPGAIFGIPVAAVVSSFFFHFLHRTAGDRTVAGRAAKRLSEREGRPVTVPREPAPGQAADVPET
ncbi:MAG TPA: AI-2E family transporter [Candidatus Limnocylindrales bacterium]|jgi:predicted PurR-regulated permease PerM|nr:AI-2E family transporter [Candidatus Limnocylindrales bacterium]